MGRRSKVEALPPELKAWLDAELVKRGFADYVQLAADLQARGADVSKSGLHRYGSVFEERLARLKMTAEQARAVVDASPDDEGAINEALIRLTQDKLMDLLVDVDLAGKKESVSLPKLTKAIADLARASVGQKRWQAEARKQALEDAAATATETARAQGLSETGVEALRAAIIGRL